ncbi:MAG TPA: hypothetical protein VM925_07515, partial [Labilithrix sp.]|nr:hypothetical protein [Labilithrix sp.]
FAGSADSRSQGALEALFARVHEEVVRLGRPEIAIDLRDCEFLNSSCFKGFIVWLEQIQDLEEEQRYHLRFRLDTTKLWQTRSLQSLSRFAADLVRVETAK